MHSDRQLIRNWCLYGVVLITAFGWVMHYLYAWFGHQLMAGLIFPVNESVWEHLKMTYWGLMLFALLEYPSLRQKVRQYFSIKLAGLLTFVFCNLIIYYSSYAIVVDHILILGISSFVLGVVFCQWIIWHKYQSKTIRRYTETSSKILLAGIALLFARFTLFPPKQKIFWDRNTNSYGIPFQNNKN